MAPVSESKRESNLLEALQKHEEKGDRQAMALDCYQLGVWHQEEGCLDAAVAMFRRALVLCEAHGTQCATYRVPHRGIGSLHQ